MRAQCTICPHECILDEGQTGLCRARWNLSGEIVCKNYGMLTSLALDPIEKKPLRRFMPGSMILSVGSFGCNLSCPFCQNHGISMAGSELEAVFTAPEDLIKRALELREYGCIGIAYTYNEPLIGYEYVRDCAALAQQAGLKNVLVTNGYVGELSLLELLPIIDALNIDLKSFNENFYKALGGSLAPVLRSIKLAASRRHVEATTLVIPGENDSEEEMSRLSEWLAGVSPEIPLHISRFFPRHLYSNKTPTDTRKITRLADIASENLKYVYTGNM